MVAPTTGDDYARCEPDENGNCRVHGSAVVQVCPGSGVSPALWWCRTRFVLMDIRAERARQFARYGTNDDLEYGTGEPWLLPISELDPEDTQEALRADYEVYEAANGGKPTWMHLVREEVAESFAETDPDRLREELIQVAALCVSWVEKIDAKRAEAAAVR